MRCALAAQTCVVKKHPKKNESLPEESKRSYAEPSCNMPVAKIRSPMQKTKPSLVSAGLCIVLAGSELMVKAIRSSADLTNLSAMS